MGTSSAWDAAALNPKPHTGGDRFTHFGAPPIPGSAARPVTPGASLRRDAGTVVAGIRTRGRGGGRPVNDGRPKLRRWRRTTGALEEEGEQLQGEGGATTIGHRVAAVAGEFEAPGDPDMGWGGGGRDGRMFFLVPAIAAAAAAQHYLGKPLVDVVDDRVHAHEVGEPRTRTLTGIGWEEIGGGCDHGCGEGFGYAIEMLLGTGSMVDIILVLSF